MNAQPVVCSHRNSRHSSRPVYKHGEGASYTVYVVKCLDCGACTESRQPDPELPPTRAAAVAPLSDRGALDAVDTERLRSQVAQELCQESRDDTVRRIVREEIREALQDFIAENGRMS